MSPTTSLANQLHAGDAFPELRLMTIAGEPIVVPADDDRLTHVQFRRFAGCPICNLHLHSVTARLNEIEDAGVREIVIFHSTEEELRRYQDDLPFAVVADPARELYRRFGVEHGARAVLNPRAWRPIRTAVANLVRTARVRRRAPIPVVPNGGNFGLPADLLVTPDGKVAAAKYGDHAYDQWTVEEILNAAANARAGASN